MKFLTIFERMISKNSSEKQWTTLTSMEFCLQKTRTTKKISQQVYKKVSQLQLAGKFINAGLPSAHRHLFLTVGASCSHCRETFFRASNNLALTYTDSALDFFLYVSLAVWMSVHCIFMVWLTSQAYKNYIMTVYPYLYRKEKKKLKVNFSSM